MARNNRKSLGLLSGFGCGRELAAIVEIHFGCVRGVKQTTPTTADNQTR